MRKKYMQSRKFYSMSSEGDYEFPKSNVLFKPAYEITLTENDTQCIVDVSFGVLIRNHMGYSMYWDVINTDGVKVRVDSHTIASNMGKSSSTSWQETHRFTDDYEFFGTKTDTTVVSKTHNLQLIEVKKSDEDIMLQIASKNSHADRETFHNITVSPITVEFDLKPKTSYILDYQARGGKTTPSAQKKWHGEDIVLADAIERGGHTFEGWLCNKDGRIYLAGETYTGNSDATFVAQWKKKRGGIARLIDLKRLLEKILSCMYTTGSSGSWTWKKYVDGTFDAWVYFSGAPTTGTHYYYGNPFYGYRVEGIYFPTDMKPIDTNYQVYVSWQVGNGFVNSSHSVSAKRTDYFNVYVLGTAASQSTVNFHAHIHGRWK